MGRSGCWLVRASIVGAMPTSKARGNGGAAEQGAFLRFEGSK